MSRPFYTALNATQQTCLGNKVLKADTYWTRLFGLLPKKDLQNDEGLWIVPCKDIHSIGMRFSFDAVFLDKDLQVVHLIEQMKPFRISPFIKQAHSVLELPQGCIKASHTHVGDTFIISLSSNT